MKSNTEIAMQKLEKHLAALHHLYQTLDRIGIRYREPVIDYAMEKIELLWAEHHSAPSGLSGGPSSSHEEG